jgi:transposase/transposase IS116/IS110/IS902 family protein
LLFVGDDWAEDHHDVELMGADGRVLARARLAEGLAGIAGLHALIGEHLAEDAAEDAAGDAAGDAAEDVAGDVGPGQVAVGIETDHGPWVQALVAAGYVVYPLNPLSAARFRQRHTVSGAKSDTVDAHTLADAVRTDRHQLRPLAGDSEQAQAVGVVARAHQTLIWERQRQVLRLRATLLEYFPAALAAFGEDLGAPEALELLAKAPDPERAAWLSTAQISAALKRARRRKVTERAAVIAAGLRTEQLAQPPAVTAAYAATVRSLVAVITTLGAEVKTMEEQVKVCFGRTRDAEIYLSQPGMGPILAARVLGEFGDDPQRFAGARNRKNYAGTSPITRRSGKRKTVHARFIRNRRIIHACHLQAFSALRCSPGARAYYQAQRDRGVGHHAAIRQLANRLVAVLHGSLKTRTPYDEDTAWAHHNTNQQTQDQQHVA